MFRLLEKAVRMYPEPVNEHSPSYDVGRFPSGEQNENREIESIP